MTIDFPISDDLNATLSAPVTAPRQAPTTFPQNTFRETCRKCGGSGVYRGFGRCFACQGKGGKDFKTVPAVRAQAKVARQQRAFNDEVANFEAFTASHPEVAAWIVANPTFEFAASLRVAVGKYGSLTENQLAAAQRGVQRDKARTQERVAREANAPAADTAGVDRLKAAFDKAIAFTAAKTTETGSPLRLRSPRITIGGVTISPAKATSANPGALYVKSGGTYLGKIAGGKFLASRDCSAEQQAQVLAFIADPKAAAEAYGKETGVCCVCNATLTSKWRLAGIGPICAEKFGW